MLAIAAVGRVLQLRLGSRPRASVEQRQRLAVAARADARRSPPACRPPAGRRRARPRRAPARARALTLGVGFLGDRRVERARAPPASGVAEHGLGGGEPHGRVGRSSVSVPSASRMTRRSALLTLILVEVGLGGLAGLSPVTGSSRLTLRRSPCTTKTCGVGLADVEIAVGQRCRAHVSTRGSPVAASSRTTASVAGNPLGGRELGDDRRADRPRRRGATANSRAADAGTSSVRPTARRSGSHRYRMTPSSRIDDARPGGTGGRARPDALAVCGRGRSTTGRPWQDQLVPLPPHLPVATLKLPQDSGARQSEIRSLESWQIVRPLVADHEARRLPDRLELAVGLDLADQTGLVMWWFGIMVE